MSDISSTDTQPPSEILKIKQNRIDLNIKKKPPRPQTEAQKANIQKALAARQKKIEERKSKKIADEKVSEVVKLADHGEEKPIIENPIPDPAPAPTPTLEKPKSEKPKEVVTENVNPEFKMMKKKIKKLELEELVQERINNALDDYKEYNQQQKEIKRLKKLEKRLEEEKAKDPYRNIKFKTVDGIIF